MRTRVRMWLIACAAIAALLVIAGNGAARRWSFEGQTFRVVWNPMNFRPAIGTVIRCRVTLGGSFVERDMAKVTGSTIGRINEASIEGCVEGEGEMRFLAERLPWTLKYQSFTGILPNIQQILTTFGAMEFRWRTGLFSTCLFPGNEVPVAFVFGWEALGRERDLVRANLSEAITLNSSDCAGVSLRVGGVGTPTYRGSVQAIRVFLI